MKFEIISEKQFKKDFSEFPTVKYTDIKKPARATFGSAGYDFYSPIDFELKPGETIKIPTGIRIFMPRDRFLMVVPRSGLGFKFRLQLDNTVGVIDSDYSRSSNEGHIWIKITNDTKPEIGIFGEPFFDTYTKTLKVKAGEAIAQGIIMRYEITDDDNATGIRNGGFGSTNNQQCKKVQKPR